LSQKVSLVLNNHDYNYNHMPSLNLMTDEEEDSIIQKYKKKWSLNSNYATIKKIIREFDALILAKEEAIG
jgi:hypothetical protein